MVCATMPSSLYIFTVMTDEVLAQDWLLTFATVQLSDKREEIRTELYDYIEVAIEIKRSMKKIMRRRLVHSTRRGVTLFPETPLQSPLVASSPHPGAFNCRDLRRNVASYRN